MADMKRISNFNSLQKYMPDEFSREFEHLSDEIKSQVHEIRLRVNKPPILMASDKHHILGNKKILTPKNISDVFEKICDYSVYSHQSDLSQGFITLPGGHRVGICGTATLDKSGNRTIKYVSSINIRIAAEYVGCADKIMKELFSDGICGALIAGPPCSGKTTILRDIARSLSSNEPIKKVAIVDEREEIAAMYRGIPQNNVGIFCDVLNAYPKGEGILLALRTLAPDVIICDEIGSEEEASAVCEGVNSGVSVISTIHVCNVDELYRKSVSKRLLKTGAFQKIAFLKGGTHRGELNNIVEVGEV